MPLNESVGTPLPGVSYVSLGGEGHGKSMPPLREVLKRTMPGFALDAVRRARARLGPPPLEDIVLHDYRLVADRSRRPRLSLVIPNISPRLAFGGVTTGVDIFLEIGRRTGCDLRVMLDDFQHGADVSLLEVRARTVGLDAGRIEVVPRTAQVPETPVRANDVFYSFNWWTTLNIRQLLRDQHQLYGGDRKPYLYAIQEYEPQFDPFSSTHMMSRLAFEPRWPCWAMFNSAELYAFFTAQGHRVERAFVFEPKISSSLRPFLDGPAPAKVRRLLVYGRPSVPRNCYPSIEKGLRRWAERYPQFAGWEVVSAGISHPPMTFGPGRTMRSLGKLSLEDYGALLRTSAAGLSLMASPHPSYPPLEMAHFGLRTVTNRYANKDLSTSHPNIVSIDDVMPDTIAEALALACRAFEAAPAAGWSAKTGRPSFLEPGSFGFLDDLAGALTREVWTGAARERVAV